MPRPKYDQPSQINLTLNQTGRFWQEESFDHLIRSLEQFTAIQRYIADNPRNLNFDEYFVYQLDADGTHCWRQKSAAAWYSQSPRIVSGGSGGGTIPLLRFPLVDADSVVTSTGSSFASLLN